jgi:hypothetical protein
VEVQAGFAAVERRRSAFVSGRLHIQLERPGLKRPSRVVAGKIVTEEHVPAVYKASEPHFPGEPQLGALVHGSGSVQYFYLAHWPRVLEKTDREDEQSVLELEQPMNDWNMHSSEAVVDLGVEEPSRS